MKFTYVVTTILEMVDIGSKERAKHSSTKTVFSVSKNIEAGEFFDDDGYPNKEGTRAITTTLLQGLIANIHSAHQFKYRDSAEHLRHIISELERGFVNPGTARKGTVDAS